MPAKSEVQPLILASLKAQPGAAVGDLVERTGKPRGSVVSALRALVEAGRVTFTRSGEARNAAKVYRLVDVGPR